MICNYGCGREAKYKFKNGNMCCEISCNKCPSKIIRGKLIGRQHTEEEKEKIRRSSIGRKHSQKSRDKMSKTMTGRKRPPELMKLIGEKLKGRKKTKEQLENMRINGKKNFLNPNYIKNWSSAVNSKPNKQESILIDFLSNNLFGWKYVGDFKVWIGGKNPDFINEEKKKIIEFFGDYYHSEKVKNKSERDQEIDRINHFKKYGYLCLVVWERELKNFEHTKNKITSFDRM